MSKVSAFDFVKIDQEKSSGISEKLFEILWFCMKYIVEVFFGKILLAKYCIQILKIY